MCVCCVCVRERDCMLCMCVYTHVSGIVYAYMRLCGICLCACECFLLCKCTCVSVDYAHTVRLNKHSLDVFSFVQRPRVLIQGLGGVFFSTVSPAEAQTQHLETSSEVLPACPSQGVPTV